MYIHIYIYIYIYMYIYIYIYTCISPLVPGALPNSRARAALAGARAPTHGNWWVTIGRSPSL